MKLRQEVAFVFNLLQDVNILRGLTYLVKRETDAHIHFLITQGFKKRDSNGTWQKELSDLVRDLKADINVIAEDCDTQAALQGRSGVLVTASESDLEPHRETAAILQSASGHFVTMTLQHGLECVGFRQSREHVIGHGRDVGFNADVICTWFDQPQLTATRVSERGKVIVTGPSSIIQRPRIHHSHPKVMGGIVCENLHSGRMGATGNHKAAFMDTFFEFCAHQRVREKHVTLRPHPGGQYVIKNKVALPENVLLNNLPIYDVNMGAYQYGISAPSTVILDMVLAGIPVGVWHDPNGIMDLGNYKGLTEISTCDDWVLFERETQLAPQAIIAKQQDYLNRLGMQTDPAAVYRRFTRLFRNLLERQTFSFPATTNSNLQTYEPPSGPTRILYVANLMLATLEISFLKPLRKDVNSGLVEAKVLTEGDIKEKFGSNHRSKVAGDWVAQKIEDFNPDIIVCCRYSGPHADQIVAAGHACKAAVIYHIDDDLLNIPKELGISKWAMHNDPKRLDTIKTLLDTSDLVYASTKTLHARLEDLGAKAPIIHGDIYCSATIGRSAKRGVVRKVGYMGTSSHAHDFDPLVPTIADYLKRNPEVTFELFGLNSIPSSLQGFGERVQIVPSVKSYTEFLDALADREWDIGLCPLNRSQFNRVKANTKWVEYTASGIASIATKGMVYDECAADGRGILVNDTEWGLALTALTRDPELRFNMVKQAQDYLEDNYSPNRLYNQVTNIFKLAQSYAKNRKDTPSKQKKTRIALIADHTTRNLLDHVLEPLRNVAAPESFLIEVIDEKELASADAGNTSHQEICRKISNVIESLKPDLIICYNYSGPHEACIIDLARAVNAPIVYHFTDDFLVAKGSNPSFDISLHDNTYPIKKVSHLLKSAALISCPSGAWKHLLRQIEISTPIFVRKVDRSSPILRAATQKPVQKVGYVGRGQIQDCLMALPAVERYLDLNPGVEFEFFGIISVPDALLRFGDRVRTIPPLENDADFLQTIAKQEWDIGLCPMELTFDNTLKSNSRWIEYTACGMATIATKGMVYDTCADSGRGLLVNADEWGSALQILTDDPELRYKMALEAQTHLLLNYSVEDLQNQVLRALALALSQKVLPPIISGVQK